MFPLQSYAESHNTKKDTSFTYKSTHTSDISLGKGVTDLEKSAGGGGGGGFSRGKIWAKY